MPLFRPMVEVSENGNPWIIFLELLPPDTDSSRPPPKFDKDQEGMLFLKFYCPWTNENSPLLCPAGHN